MNDAIFHSFIDRLKTKNDTRFVTCTPLCREGFNGFLENMFRGRLRFRDLIDVEVFETPTTIYCVRHHCY